MTRHVTGFLLLGLTLAACSPDAPPGVDKIVLDEAVSRAVGDPNTCVLIAEKDSGRVVYRYNTATACAREFPACEGPAAVTTGDVLKATVKDGKLRELSCYTLPDRSRSVGWSAGPIPGKPLVYAAMMEGDRAFPGMMMSDRLDRAWKAAKVSAP
jgi:hypothetical protein